MQHILSAAGALPARCGGLRPRLSLLFAAISVTIAVCPAQASPFDYSGPSMSGSAANALVRAFDAAGFDKGIAPPIALESYIVTIDRAPGEFDVSFSRQMTTEARELVVRPNMVGTPSPESTAEAVDGVLLPGVAAGSIIMVYREILRDTGGYVAGKIATGSYNVAYYSFAGGTYVAFIPLSAPPSLESTKAAPTPAPKDGMRCLAGDCDSRVAYYVWYRDGRVHLREQKLL
jgi:hypothetical protein